MESSEEIQRMHDILSLALDKMEKFKLWSNIDQKLIENIAGARDALCFVLQHKHNNQMEKNIVNLCAAMYELGHSLSMQLGEEDKAVFPLSQSMDSLGLMIENFIPKGYGYFLVSFPVTGASGMAYTISTPKGMDVSPILIQIIEKAKKGHRMPPPSGN